MEDGPGLTSSVQADNSHPLTSPDNDTYDNANSLQVNQYVTKYVCKIVYFNIIHCLKNLNNYHARAKGARM